MKIYLQDIINRLAKFSEELDNTTLFVDKPWIHVDTNLDYHKYIFKRNGDLLMSIKGQVQLGKWEYLASAKSIYIDRIRDKVLLNQYFIDSAVMVLKIDGTNNDLFVLANEAVIPDLDIKRYLQSVTHKKFNVITGKITNGGTLEIYRGNTETQPQIGMKATIDGEEPDDGKYQSKGTGILYELKNGRIFRIAQPVVYRSKNGQFLTIEQVDKESISNGDLVYINNMPAMTGKYKLGLFKTIKIFRGKICN